MSKIKDWFIVGGMLILAAIMEIIRQKTNIPVSFGDLLFGPASIFLSVVFLRDLFCNKKSKSEFESIVPKKRIRNFIIGTLFFLFGLLMIWLGALEPFVFRSGVRGAAHGYTIIAIGVFICSVGMCCGWPFICIKIIQKKHS